MPDVAFIPLLSLILLLLLFFCYLTQKFGCLEYSIFFLMWKETTKPPALFSAPEKAQPGIIHSLFYKGKVFDGVWGIKCWNENEPAKEMEWKIGLFWSPRSKTYHTQSHKPTWNLAATSYRFLTPIKMELQGNKTKRRSGNEAAKENRTDFVKVSAI